MGRNKVALPCDKLSQDYNSLCKHLFEKEAEKLLQIQPLTQLRDTLLPKLMKGKIQIRNEEL